MTARLTSLTPFHIGCGHIYRGHAFIQKDKEVGVLKEDIHAWPQEKRESFLHSIGIKKKAPLDAYRGQCEYILRSDIRNVRRLHAFVKQGDMCYVPGSTIKGSIRTALFYVRLLKDRTLYEELVERIEAALDYKRKDMDVRKVMDAFVEKPFIYSDAGKSFDVVRALTVSDSEPFAPGKGLKIMEMNPVNLQGRDYGASCYEMGIPDLEIVVPRLGFVCKSAGLRKEMRLNVLKALKTFSQDLLECESEVLDAQLSRHLKELIECNADNAPLLRLGAGQGGLSITINILLRKKNRNLFKKLAENLGWKGKDSGPKTRRLVGGKLPGFFQLHME